MGDGEALRRGLVHMNVGDVFDVHADRPNDVVFVADIREPLGRELARRDLSDAEIDEIIAAAEANPRESIPWGVVPVPVADALKLVGGVRPELLLRLAEPTQDGRFHLVSVAEGGVSYALAHATEGWVN